MKQAHDHTSIQPTGFLFNAEFAKQQYFSLYRFIDGQGDQPKIIYPGILLYVRETMENLRLNDDHSVFYFLHGLKMCLAYVEMTQKQGSKFERAYKTIFRGSLESVCKSIFKFLLEKDVALGKTKKAKIFHQHGVSLPTFTSEMKDKLSSDAYVSSDLPSVKRALSM